MKILYFAWVRTTIGKGADELDHKPEGVERVSDLFDWLSQQGDGYRQVIDKRTRLRVAINQNFATPDDLINDGDEIALFPPVTGG